MKYKHSLNQALARGLLLITQECQGEVGVPVEIRRLGMSRTQWDNFQKLRYWGFVEKSHNQTDGSRLRGSWELTTHGLLWVRGVIAVSRTAVTYRGGVVDYEGQPVFWKQVAYLEGYEQRADYGAQSEPATVDDKFNHLDGQKET